MVDDVRYNEILTTMPEFIQAYLIGLASIREHSTLKVNLYTYRLFLEWLIATKRTTALKLMDITLKDLGALDLNAIHAFFAYLVGGYVSHRKTKDAVAVAANKVKGLGIKRKASTLNSLFTHIYETLNEAEREQFKYYNVMSLYMRQLKTDGSGSENIQHFLEPNEQTRLLEAVEDLSGLKGRPLELAKQALLRNRAIIITLLRTGMRVSSLCWLDVGDVDLKESMITIRLKGGRKVEIPITSEVLKALTDYLAVRESSTRNKKASSPVSKALFLSNRDERIATRTVQDLIKKYCAKAGLRKDISVHWLRHTFGTDFYTATSDINLTSKMLGHRDPSVTSRFYAQTSTAKMREGLDKLPSLFTD